MIRTDVHSVSRFVPSDYEYVLSFSLAHVAEGWPIPAINMDRVVELRRSERFAVVGAAQGATNLCDVCGARFLHGDVWRHLPSRELITLGHECADKYASMADRSEWAALRGSAINRVLAAAHRRDTAARARDFLAANAGLAAALVGDHAITRDLARKLARFGDLSPAQVALAFKLAREARERVEREANEPPAVAIPEALLSGRVRVRGLVLVTKWKETNFGGALKMLLQVEAEGGAFKLWGTVPAALDSDALRGSVVEFDAKLERSRDDAAFGFFSRPTKAVVVAEAPAASAAA